MDRLFEPRLPALQPWWEIAPEAWGRGIAWTIYLVLLAVLLAKDRILSGSGDLAHHLEMLDAVRRHGVIPQSAGGYLGEFYAYPKLSHQAAALWSLFGLSSIDALMAMAVFSAGFVWLCLLALAGRVSHAVLALAAGLSLAATHLLGAAVGREVVDNFFYAQLVSEAAFAGGLILGFAILSRSPRLFAIYAAMATYVCGWVHLVGALKLAIALGLLAIFHGLRAGRSERRGKLWIAATLGGIGLGLIASPSLRVMAAWGGANGSLILLRGLSHLEFGLAALVLALGSMAGLARLAGDPDPDLASAQGRSKGAALTILIYAAATGLAAAAQWIAFEGFHLGAPYAVFKHVFGLFTALAVAAPTLAWLFWPRAGAGSATRPRLVFGLLIAAHLALMGDLFLHPSQFDVARLQDRLRRLQAMRPAAEEGGQDVLFVDSRSPHLVSYIGSLVGLRAARSANSFSVLMTGHPEDATGLATFVTEVGDPFYDRPGCRRGRPEGPLVRVDPGCAEVAKIEVAAGGAGLAYLRQGWGDPEPKGVWSVSRLAVLEAPLPQGLALSPPPVLQVATFAFLPAEHPVQTVVVQVEGGISETVQYSRAEALSRVLVLPLPDAALRRGRVRVSFQIADPVSPQQLGLGPDPRRLGVGVGWVRILSSQTAAEARP